MEKEQIVRYGYFNDLKEYCIVLDKAKLKELYGADNIYLDTEE